jgi:hypothetical protein
VKGWFILSITLLIGFVLGVAAATKGPTAIGPYLPRSINGSTTAIEGQVARKQRDGNRLLVRVDTAQGPMLVAFTQKAADLDVLLDAGDTVMLLTSGGYATFIDDPALERVKNPRQAQTAPSSPPPASADSGRGAVR